MQQANPILISCFKACQSKHKM